MSVEPRGRRLRVAVSYTSRHWGGVLGVTVALVRALRGRGHDVLVLCRPGSMAEEKLRDLVATAPIAGGMDFHPRSLLQAWRALRPFRPDVLLTMTKKDVRLTAPVGRMLGVPVVVRHANDQPAPRGPYGRMLYDAVASHHVVNADATRRTLLGSAPWLTPARVSVVYNGVDIETFARADPARFDLPERAVAIGFLGRLEPIKGVEELALAWPGISAALPDAHLLLAGKGSREAWLRERLGSDPRVHFLGYRTDAAAVLRALDLLVLPSHREGAPNVVLEAMASGVPVVATAVSGTPELLEDGATGLLVPPRDPEALQRAVVRLARDAGLRARIAAAASHRASRDFSLTRMIDEYERLLLRVARRTGDSASSPPA